MLLSSSDTRVTLMHQCLFTNTALRELVLENTQHQLTFLALLPWVALPILSILVYLSKNVKLCKYYTLRIPGDLYLAVWKDLATNWNVRTYRRTQILEPTGGLKYLLQSDPSISIYTLLVWVSFCLYPKNVKTAEPIGPDGMNASLLCELNEHDAFIPEKKLAN